MTHIDRLAEALKAFESTYATALTPPNYIYGGECVTAGVEETDLLVEAAQAVIDAYSWQPIETAPKDQKSILGMNIRSKLSYVTHRKAIGSDTYIRHNEIEGRGWKPTHWMPLPEPPESE